MLTGKSTAILEYFHYNIFTLIRTLVIEYYLTFSFNIFFVFEHLSYCSVVLRDYATTKKTDLEPLLQKLDSEVRRYGRIAKRDIDEVFDEIQSKNDITSSQSLLVIRCCGNVVVKYVFYLFISDNQ